MVCSFHRLFRWELFASDETSDYFGIRKLEKTFQLKTGNALAGALLTQNFLPGKGLGVMYSLMKTKSFFVLLGDSSNFWKSEQRICHPIAGSNFEPSLIVGLKITF